MTSFSELGLNPTILRNLEAEGYTTPTPIQEQSIPSLMDGRDLMGIAQTGTGKTAAFALPLLHRLAADKRPAGQRCARVLVLAPTRELAAQIEASFKTYGRGLGLRTALVFGGVGDRPQARTMASGVDILVATPGRLMDHMGQGNIRLDGTQAVVLDEVDRMLDIGFIHAIRRVMSMVPKERQTLFFSATLPPDIKALAAAFLVDPVEVQVTPVASTGERVEQRVLHIPGPEKRHWLVRLLQEPEVNRAIVFTRTKHRADQVTKHLEMAGVGAAAIHGNKSQGQRERALGAFRNGRVSVLVATDIAARGIDVDGVSHVFNYDLPDVAEAYVHRIGRTARAGADGLAISFCEPDQRGDWRQIENLIKRRVSVIDPVTGHAGPPPEPYQAREPRPASQQRPRYRSGPPRSSGGGQGHGAGQSGRGDQQRHTANR